jgi:hypothetical protein
VYYSVGTVDCASPFNWAAQQHSYLYRVITNFIFDYQAIYAMCLVEDIDLINSILVYISKGLLALCIKKQ